MAVIAGVGYNTLFRTAYKKRFGFLWEHMDRVTSRHTDDPHREGDGRVPLASAKLEWVGETRYVNAERIPALGASGLRGRLRFLTDKPLKLPTTPQGALTSHLADDAMSSATRYSPTCAPTSTAPILATLTSLRLTRP